MEESTAAAVSDLRAEAKRLGIEISAQAAQQFATYIDTLLYWRERISLTGADSAGAIVTQHIVDSLHVAPLIKPGDRLVDMGSGAGFPALPLAICLPETGFTLVESRRKRANFLREVVRQGRIDNVEIREQRVEELPPSLHSSFDAATSRAFGSLALFMQISAPLLKPGGLAIAMKGPAWSAEMSANEHFSKIDLHQYGLRDGHKLTLVVAQRG